MSLRAIAVLCALFGLTSCMSVFFEGKAFLHPVAYSALPGWRDGHDLDGFFAAFLNSCKEINKRDPDALFHPDGVGGKVGNWQRICREAKQYQDTGPDERAHFIQTRFKPYEVYNWQEPEGRFTGYFESSMEGSRVKTGEYRYPVYGLPDDFVKGQPYHLTRKDIQDGALKGKGLEIAWVKDPVRLFFMHIQGSGTLHMPDGSMMRVGFAGKNGRPYRPIGRYLIEKGYVSGDKVGAKRIQDYLYEHSDKRNEVFAYNESFIFFKEIKGAGGPIGAENVPLTAGYSLAVDNRYIPYGAPIWLDTTLSHAKEAYQRLVVAQDTGSAIRGPVRGDIFFGSDFGAETLASDQNSFGHYYMLLPVGLFYGR